MQMCVALKKMNSSLLKYGFKSETKFSMIALAIITGLIANSLPTRAEDVVSLDKLRAESLNNPTDYNKSLAYARAAISAREYEAAIVVLERLLFYSPNLASIRFQLGNLYARLGAYAMAAYYYETTLSSGKIDDDMRMRAEAYLGLSRKEVAPDKFSGSVQFGYQYKTNPASVPSNYTTLPTELEKYKTGGRNSLYALGQFSYRHDFATGRGDRFELDAQAYTSKQFEISELDFAAISVKAGPRIVLTPNSFGGISLRPFIATDQSWLNGKTYASMNGVGASIGIPINITTYVEPGVEWRHVNVNLDKPESSSATLNSGVLTKAYVDWRWMAADDITLLFNLYASRNDADPISSCGLSLSPCDLLSSNTVGGTLTVKYEFAPLVKTSPFNWSISPYIGYADITFDEINNSISDKRRHDRVTRLGVQLIAPITAQWSAVANIDYRKNRSNIDGSYGSGYDFNHAGWSTMFGMMTSF